MTAHTPAPWKPGERAETANLVYGRDRHGNDQPIVVAQVFGTNLDEIRANRALVLAAPDLLDALRDCVAALEITARMARADPKWSEGAANLRALVNRSRAAIAAAEQRDEG